MNLSQSSLKAFISEANQIDPVKKSVLIKYLSAEYSTLKHNNDWKLNVYDEGLNVNCDWEHNITRKTQSLCPMQRNI